MTGLPMLGVDAPSSRRPWTPDERTRSGGIRVRVKRCCNGCGATIGDITDEELAAAIEGRRLSDVTGECPVCTPWTGSTALVPWAPVQTFNAEPRRGRPLPFPEIRYSPPRDTMDPRWEACREHRVACDCREAEHAEQRAEWRYESRARRALAFRMRAIARLHAPKGEVPYCTACAEPGPCATRALAVQVLKDTHEWWDDE